MRIILAGGGTGGPIMPLIAVAKKIKDEYPKADFLLVGTHSGLEKKIARDNKIKFIAIPSGKWRRYFSLLNIFAPFFVLAGFVKSLVIIRNFKPDVIFAAGGFVSVPVCYAAFVMRKKILIHQQDIVPSLTNKLIAPIASKITITFEHSSKDFSVSSGLFWHKDRHDKIVWTGNPVRDDVLDKPKKSSAEIKARLKLDKNLPTALIIGGATGARVLNNIVEGALPSLVEKLNVIHVTGKGKGIDFKHRNYHPFDYITNMGEVLHVSDIVVSRAGLSTISELSALKKVAVIIPLPESHQILNAYVLAKAKAALVLDQENLYPEMLLNLLAKVMIDGDLQRELSENIGEIMPKNASQKIANFIIQLWNRE